VTPTVAESIVRSTDVTTNGTPTLLLRQLPAWSTLSHFILHFFLLENKRKKAERYVIFDFCMAGLILLLKKF